MSCYDLLSITLLSFIVVILILLNEYSQSILKPIFLVIVIIIMTYQIVEAINTGENYTAHIVGSSKLEGYTKVGSLEGFWEHLIIASR